MQSHKIKKGGNSNLIDCNAIMQNFKKGGNSILIDCNVIVQNNQRLPRACNCSPGLKLLSKTTQLHCGSHLGGRARLPDTILEEDHQMTIPSKFGSN